MGQGLAEAKIANPLIKRLPQGYLICREHGFGREPLNHLLGESSETAIPKGLELIHRSSKPKANNGITLIRSHRRGHLPTLLGDAHDQKIFSS